MLFKVIFLALRQTRHLSSTAALAERYWMLKEITLTTFNMNVAGVLGEKN